MKLTGEEARDVVYGDAEDWKEASVKVVEDTTRWSILCSQVFEHIPTGKTYEFGWSEGATEQQCESAYEYTDFYEPREVKEEEILVKKWVKV